MDKNEYLTVKELSQILGLSRVTIFNKIKKGQIKATMVGKTYIIPKKQLKGLIYSDLSDKLKSEIEKGKILYPGLISKAAFLFYLLIKNHPFQNGNKRIAMTSLFYFLYKNKKWLKVDNQELYNFVKWVAASNPRFKEETVKAIEKFIIIYQVRL
jgi:death-on-curing family protein